MEEPQILNILVSSWPQSLLKYKSFIFNMSSVENLTEYRELSVLFIIWNGKEL